MLDKGCDYRTLKESYILFVCLDDPFNKNLPVYTFENVCRENGETLLDDKTYKIFYNAGAYKSETNKKIKDFLSYVKTGKAKSTFTKEIQSAVTKIKEDEELRGEYMENYAKYFDMVHLGEERGAHNAKLETVRNGIKLGISRKLLHLLTGLSLEEINQIK